MTTKDIRTSCKEVEKGVMGARDSGYVWIGNSDGNAESFVGFTQLCSEKTDATLKSVPSVAYVAHIMFLNISVR